MAAAEEGDDDDGVEGWRSEDSEDEEEAAMRRALRGGGARARAVADDDQVRGLPGGGIGGQDAAAIAAAAPREHKCEWCGALTAAPDVHVLLGRFGGEPECVLPPCRDDMERVRQRFVRRTDELWRAVAPGGVPAAPYTYADLGARLGGAAGTPRRLSEDLPRVFEQTWGAWAAKTKEEFE